MPKMTSIFFVQSYKKSVFSTFFVFSPCFLQKYANRNNLFTFLLYNRESEYILYK